MYVNGTRSFPKMYMIELKVLLSHSVHDNSRDKKSTTSNPSLSDF